LGGKTKEIWSKDQVRFAEKYDDIDWDGLVPYGPFPDGKWKIKILGHKAKLDDVVAGKLHLMEIELSTPRIGSEEVYNKVTAYLKEHGVMLCDPQQSKTLRLFRDRGLIDDQVNEEL
jgi:subtilisin-like proprotein convertase family protein